MRLGRLRKALLSTPEHFKRLIKLSQDDIGAAEPCIIGKFGFILFKGSLVELGRTLSAA